MPMIYLSLALNFALIALVVYLERLRSSEQRELQNALIALSKPEALVVKESFELEGKPVRTLDDKAMYELERSTEGIKP